MRAKTFINEERLQACARTLRQQATERNAQRKIDAEGFAAAVQFVGAFTGFIADDDVKRFDFGVFGYKRALAFQPHPHAPIRHDVEQAVGFFFDFGQDGFDNQGLHAFFAECFLKFLERMEAFLPGRAFLFQSFEPLALFFRRFQFLAGGAQFAFSVNVLLVQTFQALAGFVFLLFDIGKLAYFLAQGGDFGGLGFDLLGEGGHVVAQRCQQFTVARQAFLCRMQVAQLGFGVGKCAHFLARFLVGGFVIA